MNIGATVVTSSSEMIRGLVSVTRSARIVGFSGANGRSLGLSASRCGNGVKNDRDPVLSTSGFRWEPVTGS